jgi:hypothetical protein
MVRNYPIGALHRLAAARFIVVTESISPAPVRTNSRITFHLNFGSSSLFSISHLPIKCIDFALCKVCDLFIEQVVVIAAMDETENRPIQDPSADTYFLNGSVDELPEPEVPIEPSLAIQDDDVSNPPTVSSGQVVDSTGAIHIPVNSGNDCDDRLVVTRTLPPSDDIVSSNQPTLPSGEIIDSKNTLQSFNTRAAVPLTNRKTSDANMDIHDSDVLPTAAVWIPPSQASVREPAVAETVYMAELIPQETSRRQTTLLLIGFVVLAVVGASVVAGVCSSGKCSSNDSGTSSPAVIPIDVVVSDFVNSIKLSDQNISVNGTNAEDRALAWIVRDDPFFTPEALRTLSLQSNETVMFHIFQRYPLAVLWFQQVDVNGLYVNPWFITGQWLRGKECDWFGIKCLNGSVTDIRFFDYDKNEGNSFVGSIPPDIGLLTSLSSIVLRAIEDAGMVPDAGNGTGRIPNAPSKVPNNVIGTIPESIRHCSQMSLFDIAGNSVIGTLPSFLGQWTDLLLFDVTQNKITGTIPESIGNWSQIITAYFFSNKFTGAMPIEICPNIQGNDTLVSDCNLNCSCCSACQSEGVLLFQSDFRNNRSFRGK